MLYNLTYFLSFILANHSKKIVIALNYIFVIILTIFTSFELSISSFKQKVIPLLFEKNDSQKRESQNYQKLLLKLYPVSLYSIHCILIDSIVTGYYPPRSFVCNITSNKGSVISQCL